MKLKYVLLIFIIALSFAGCGEDDTVEEIEEQQTTDDDGNPDNGGDGNDPNLLLCTIIENFNYEIINGELVIDWDDCASTDGSVVTYNIDIKRKYWSCDSGGNRFHDFIFDEFSNSSYTLENLPQLGIYKVHIRAVDSNGNWSTAFTEIIHIKPTNGVFNGDMRIYNSAFFEFIDGANIHTVNGNVLTVFACDTGGGNYHFGTLTDFIPLSGLETITGDLILTANGDVTSLEGFESLTTVGGDIVISRFSSLTDVSALDNLTSLNNIRFEDLYSIENLDLFNSVTGSVGDIDISVGIDGVTINILNNITSAGSFKIRGASADNTTNYVLGNVTALSNATTIANIDIKNAVSVQGFNNVVSTGSLILNDVTTLNSESLSQLKNVEDLSMINMDSPSYLFLNNLEEINNSIFILGSLGFQNLDFSSVISSNPIDFKIWGNPNLQSITGLTNITSLNSYSIRNNPMLTGISFLENVSQINGAYPNLEIKNNDMLTNLDGLSNLIYIECPGQLIVTDNFNLGDLCGLQTLFTNNGLCSFEATIENNGYNPTPLQITNGDCSL